MNERVLIGVVTNEYARHAAFYDYYNTLIKPQGSAVAINHNKSPASSRNEIIELALGDNFDRILFIDDDQAYKPDSLLQLLNHDVDIVSGLYLGRAYPHRPLVFDLAEPDGSCRHYGLRGDEKGLIEIVAAGLGFCLIKTSVFKKLEKPYIRLGELNSEEWCDDLGFFKRVREAGIKIYCDFDLKIGHMGSMTIWPENVKNQWLAKYDTGYSESIGTPLPQVAKELLVEV